MLRRLGYADRTGHTAGDGQQQGNRTPDRALLLCWINAALIALAGIRQHAPAARAAHHRLRWKPGDFEENIDSVRAHRRPRPAHDSSESDGAVAIGDQQDIWRDFDRLAIQQGDLLTFTGL